MAPDLDRSRDLGRILDDAFALYRARWRALLLASFAVVAPVQVAVLGVGLGWLWTGYDDRPPIGETAASSVAQLLVLTPLVTAITVHVVQGAVARRPLSGRAALVAGLEAFPALFGAVLLVAIGVGAGLLLFVVPGIVIAVRCAVVPQAVVLDGARGGAALRRSFELVRGRAWWTFGVLLTVEILISVASAAISVPLGELARAVDAQGVQLAATIVAETLTLPMLALVTTLLYFSLRARQNAESRTAGATMPPPEEGLRPAPPLPEAPVAPPPSSEAWERRRREGWEPPV